MLLTLLRLRCSVCLPGWRHGNCALAQVDCRVCALRVSWGLDSGFHWLRCPSNGQVRQLEGVNGFLTSFWVSFLFLFCLDPESCSIEGSELSQRHCTALRYPFTELSHWALCFPFFCITAKRSSNRGYWSILIPQPSRLDHAVKGMAWPRQTEAERLQPAKPCQLWLVFEFRSSDGYVQPKSKRTPVTQNATSILFPIVVSLLSSRAPEALVLGAAAVGVWTSPKSAFACICIFSSSNQCSAISAISLTWLRVFELLCVVCSRQLGWAEAAAKPGA